MRRENKVKPGLQKGQTAQVEITVTPDMSAHFEGHTVHPLYSTSSLIHHMEWTCRKTILPYLEPEEEGMGLHVDVSHLMLTPIGMNVKIKATITEVRDNRVVAEVEAHNWRGKVARGTITQAIVKKQWLENKINEMTVIDQLVKEDQQSPV
jgi:predicted thioesterase